MPSHWLWMSETSLLLPVAGRWQAANIFQTRLSSSKIIYQHQFWSVKPLSPLHKRGVFEQTSTTKTSIRQQSVPIGCQTTTDVSPTLTGGRQKLPTPRLRPRIAKKNCVFWGPQKRRLRMLFADLAEHQFVICKKLKMIGRRNFELYRILWRSYAPTSAKKWCMIGNLLKIGLWNKSQITNAKTRITNIKVPQNRFPLFLFYT